eukprot:36554-Eustigmatos_ZCMA.PRE.1
MTYRKLQSRSLVTTKLEHIGAQTSSCELRVGLRRRLEAMDESSWKKQARSQKEFGFATVYEYACVPVCP